MEDDIKEGTVYQMLSKWLTHVDATNQFSVLLLSHCLGVKEHGFPVVRKTHLTWWAGVGTQSDWYFEARPLLTFHWAEVATSN